LSNFNPLSLSLPPPLHFLSFLPLPPVYRDEGQERESEGGENERVYIGEWGERGEEEEGERVREDKNRLRSVRADLQ